MDRLCPKCGQRFRADVTICPTHRVSLVADPFIGRTLGDYHIKGYLGQGAMGVVYWAEPAAAVKILNVVRARMQPELVRRFELEAKAIARLESPHTVRLYDAGTTTEGHLYITMELLRGETLQARIRARRRLPPEQVADIAYQAASALTEAHDKWVVHRDIKPDNLFIEPAEGGRPFVRVLDFGVVRINSDSVARSVTGTVAGTPAYMSPEQLKSEKDIDGRTDIYSLGVALYQALTGRNPFQGDGLMETIQRHLYEPVPDLSPEVPEALGELIGDMLSKHRGHRPQTMAEVQARLVSSGLVGEPPVRLAGPVDGFSPEARITPLAVLETDPAFQRARQVTPRARPADPVDDDDTLSSDGWPVRHQGDLVLDEITSGRHVIESGAHPWRASAPPSDRPSIDAPPSERPSTSQPVVPVADPDLLRAPDLAPQPEELADSLAETWSLEPPSGDTGGKARRPERGRLMLAVFIFGLGTATGIGFASFSGGDAPAPTEVRGDPTAGVPALMREARLAADNERWSEALARVEQALTLDRRDPSATALRARVVREAAARETYHEILDRIADEQWQAAQHRIESFPERSVYRPRVEALSGLVVGEQTRADLERGFLAALRSDWVAAAEIRDRMYSRKVQPARLPLLDAAIERERFRPSEYARWMLEARAHMNDGDWRLAMTRLRQAAEDASPDDTPLARRTFVCARALGEWKTALDHARIWRRTERDTRYAPVIGHAISQLEARVKP